MGYEGHTVMVPDYEERKLKTQASLKKLVATKDVVEAAGIPAYVMSSGGTGTYDITGRYPRITELQAGSYITMDTKYRDVMEVDFECALYVISQVISTPRPGVAIIDAGLKTMTSEFGLPFVSRPEGWRVTSLSEEHGKLEWDGGPALHSGNRVELLPSHGCTTINLHDSYVALRDDDLVEVHWPIAGRGKIR